MNRKFRSKDEFYADIEERISEQLRRTADSEKRNANIFRDLLQTVEGQGSSVVGFEENEFAFVDVRVRHQSAPEFLRVSLKLNFVTEEERLSFTRKLKLMQNEYRFMSRNIDKVA